MTLIRSLRTSASRIKADYSSAASLCERHLMSGTGDGNSITTKMRRNKHMKTIFENVIERGGYDVDGVRAALKRGATTSWARRDRI